MVAALFVQSGGVYFGLDGVDPWDEARDARLYSGPRPVVAHPPCERWGRYWNGGPSARVRRIKGDDGGCFESAVRNVRSWGGVLEHPEGSHAFRAWHLPIPRWRAGWSAPDTFGGRSCCVPQGNYGHLARKMTWLYAVGVDFPELSWEPPTGLVRLDEGFHSADERRRAVRTGVCQRLSKSQRLATPPAFRDLLLSMAKSVSR